MFHIPTFRLYLLILLLLSSTSVIAQALFGPVIDEELEALFDDEEMISIATGTKQVIYKAPAVTSVITARDIEAIGATDLDEVLSTVPGLHVGFNSAYVPVYSFRGIYSEFNPQVLVLINNVPITHLFLGNRGQIWGGMPVNAIQRIEIIRGPGSALYGADAFAGVINIVTKGKNDIRGTQAGFRAGSFDSQDAWLLHGQEWAGFDFAVSLEFHTTDGQREKVDADLQSLLDRNDGTDASLAPGPVSVSRNNFDSRMELARGDWLLRAGYQRRRDFGTGIGVSQALGPENRFSSDRWNTDLSYHDQNFYDNWDLEARISYLQVSQEVVGNNRLFPAGTGLGLGLGPLFPDGLIGNPEIFERQTHVEFSTFYLGFEQHRPRVGIGYQLGELYDVKESKNFGIDPATGQPLPPGSPVMDVSATPFVFLQEAERTNWHVYAQDQWSFAPDWELTAGVRYDYYSDFGSTVNPRVALVWATLYNLDTKLLYGEAFRAPAFSDTGSINNPITLGNPKLQPEELRTLELVFEYQAPMDLHLSLNLFRYEWRDIILFDVGSEATRVAQNEGEQTGYGLELSANWKIDRMLQLRANYAFQRSKNEASGSDAGNAPNHQIYLRSDWEFQPYWYLNAQLDWVGKRKRPTGDSRADLDGYTLTHLTLRRKYVHDQWDFAVSVRNLFDQEAREPSSPAIPNDLPRAGRSFFVETRFNF